MPVDPLFALADFENARKYFWTSLTPAKVEHQ